MTEQYHKGLRLSRSQIKEASRQPGLWMLVQWPEHIPQPDKVVGMDDHPAPAEAARYAIDKVAEAASNAGLEIDDEVLATRADLPVNSGKNWQWALAVYLFHPRWRKTLDDHAPSAWLSGTPGSDSRPPNPKDVGMADYLRWWRKSHGLTAQQLADLLGVTLRTVQGWEAGKSMAAPKMLHLALRELDRQLNPTDPPRQRKK